MFGWRRRGKGCWTVTKGREYWYPVKVRIVGRKLWRFRLFDLIGLETLIGTPVLLAATGGSDRHALVIEHQLRPLFAFFQSLTLPVGVYATESDFADYRIASDALTARIRLAVDAALPVLHQSAGGLARIA